MVDTNVGEGGDMALALLADQIRLTVETNLFCGILPDLVTSIISIVNFFDEQYS